MRARVQRLESELEDARQRRGGAEGDGDGGNGGGRNGGGGGGASGRAVSMHRDHGDVLLYDEQQRRHEQQLSLHFQARPGRSVVSFTSFPCVPPALSCLSMDDRSVVFRTCTLSGGLEETSACWPGCRLLLAMWTLRASEPTPDRSLRPQ
eukprot:6205890-Pleurochrysis_carterae.AAC.3